MYLLKFKKKLIYNIINRKSKPHIDQIYFILHIYKGKALYIYRNGKIIIEILLLQNSL